MVKLFYSYNDGSVYVLHKECPLELLMKEQAGGDGLLIFASKKAFEIVEYMNGVESGFTTRIVPKVKEPLSGFMCDMDKCINEFFDYIGIIGRKSANLHSDYSVRHGGDLHLTDKL